MVAENEHFPFPVGLVIYGKLFNLPNTLTEWAGDPMDIPGTLALGTLYPFAGFLEHVLVKVVHIVEIIVTPGIV
jgi:hypothetical protein